MQRGIIGYNMTNFFNRELFMYSLGDIKFKKPISLKKVAYTTGFLIAWALPMYFIFGLQFNVFYFAALLVPPIFLGHYATKPIFEGKTLIAFVVTMVKFLFEPSGWCDLKAQKSMKESTYHVDHEIWIGRRRELNILADLQEAKNERRK